MSVANAFDLLARNKTVGDDVFRNIYADPATKYPAIKESIAAFQDASSKKRIMDKPTLVARYVRVLAFMVEQEQHVQHLSVSDWESIVQFLGKAYAKLNTGTRDLGFVKSVSVVFYVLMLLLESRESVDPNCFTMILEMCEDYCGEGPQRETSCHQYIMACVRLMTQMRFEAAHHLGNRLLQMGRPRHERFRYEMFAFACLIPQKIDDLRAIGPSVIDSHEVEFIPAPDMGLQWFRPSPDADLAKFTAAKALSKQVQNTSSLQKNHPYYEPSAKRMRPSHEDIDLMAHAFGSINQNLTTADLLAWPSRSFWVFVVLAQRASFMAHSELPEVWRFALDHIQYSECASGACFCLAQLVPRIVDPTYIELSVLGRLQTLLTTMGESSHPELSSGSLALWNSLAHVRLLDHDFQELKASKLRAWIRTSINKPPNSLLISFFNPESPISHIDARGIEEIRSLETFSRVTSLLENLEPDVMKGPLPLYKPQEVHIEGNVFISHDFNVQSVRDALWELAMIAHLKLPISHFKLPKNTEAVSNYDIRAIVWFADIASNNRWPREYFSAALSLVTSMKPEQLSIDHDVRRSLDLAITLLDDPQFGVGTLVAGHPESVQNGDPSETLRSLPQIFQAYSLQRSPSVARNVLRLMSDPRYISLPEYDQLMTYFKTFIAQQSPFSRLRPYLGALLGSKETLIQLVGGSSLDNAMKSIPHSMESDQVVLSLLKALPSYVRKPAGFVLMARGGSVAQTLAFLLEENLLVSTDVERVTAMLFMTTPQNLFSALVTPLIIGPFSESLQSMAILFNSEDILESIGPLHEQFLSLQYAPSTFRESAFMIEDILRSCTYMGSPDEKIECAHRCWLFIRALKAQNSEFVLEKYVRGVHALFENFNERFKVVLETIFNDTLFGSEGGVQGYKDLADDLAYMDLPKLAKKASELYEVVDPMILNVLGFFDSVEFDSSKAPGLILELLKAGENESATFEKWSLVFKQLVLSVRHDLPAMLDAFNTFPRRKEVVSALQLWTFRLRLDQDFTWMGFIGQVSAAVGNELDTLGLHRYEGGHKSDLFLTAFMKVYKGLPYSKRWHLHRFLQSTTPESKVVDSYLGVNLRYPNKKPLSQVFISASQLSGMVLPKFGLLKLEATVFEEIPELLQDFLPLLLAVGLEPRHESYIKDLLTSKSDLRLIGLRIVQRYYETNKLIIGSESVVMDACRASGKEFAELGIACAEILWGSESQELPDLPAYVIDALRTFYRLSRDQDFQSVNKVCERDNSQLSHMHMGSIWQELDFNMVSFEATGNSARLQQSLEETGLWGLAYKAAGTSNFYDYKQAWWLQQWDLPAAETRQTQELMWGENQIYAPLFNLFSGRTKTVDAFARLAQIDLALPSLLNGMINDDDGAIELINPVIRHGRELFALQSGSDFRVAQELQRFAAQLRNAGELNGAAKYALRLECLAHKSDSSQIHLLSTVESSHTAWSLGNQSFAITMLQNLLTDHNLGDLLSTLSTPMRTNGDYTLAKIYCRLGTWARFARHESDESILHRYFMKAENCTESTDQEQVYHDFARFCDAASHDASLVAELEDLERMKAQRQREVDHLKTAASEAKTDKDGVRRKLYQAQKALNSETVDHDDLLNRKKQLTLKCVESYLKSFKAGESYGEDMDRFIALWFELVADTSVNKLIYEQLKDNDAILILCRRFLPWMNQLTSRLGSATCPFQDALQLVIITALQQHPYHTMWQFVNLYWTGTTSDAASMERKGVAKAILGRIRTKSPRYALLRDISSCAKQMLSLSKVPVDRKTKTKSLRDFGAMVDRWWRRDFVKMKMPVPTSTIVPQTDANYEGIPTVVSVSTEVTIAGGLSSPKIMTFVDSTGVTSRMVLKHGTDDLRQDAIMQQVFGIANDLLAKLEKRNLRVRTYNVIPLGPAGGAIEFVDGACSLQEVLEPLHQKYGGSEEYTLSYAREVMRNVQRGERATRIEAFKKVMAHTQPQMRKFWPSKMPDVHSWLSAKTNWCRSTAVMSIIGYMMGLGDRHCSNLLVDTISGEVVHIDLGIAFDQGRLLSVPETVPFRLTRDMVDGMGICGVDGPFTLSARTTLSLVREQKSRIMTVLEVLKHDALYSWRLPPLRLKEGDGEQDIIRPEWDNSSTGQAESALRGVKHKLSLSLNVEATVRDLVARARDTSNLAVMFCGWSPFY